VGAAQADESDPVEVIPDSSLVDDELNPVLDPRRVKVAKAVETWVQQLINLDGRNQLLFYRDLKVATLNLESANPVALNHLLSERTVRLGDLFPRPEAFAVALKSASAIRKRAKEVAEDRGVNVCFIAVGMATWTNERSTATPQAPVFLRPLNFRPRGVAEGDFDVVLAGDALVNPALIRFLAHHGDVEIDDEQMLDLLPTSGPMDSTVAFEWLKKSAATIPGFEVLPRRVIGTFSYQKMPMVADIEANLEHLVTVDLIAAIAGDDEARKSVRAFGESVSISEPDLMPPAAEHLVLDADASQAFAVNSVLAGRNLVIKGPPGTGKSQTIANLIASLAAKGQSVLFVAEKRAAIDAVVKRLVQQGLGGLVLDVHDGAQNRSRIAKELGSVLRSSGEVPLPNQSEIHARLENRRGILNAQTEALHMRREPWGCSVFEARNNVLALEAQHGSICRSGFRLVGQVLSQCDQNAAERIGDSISEYAHLGGFQTTHETSPWADAVVISGEEASAALELVRQITRRTLPEFQKEAVAILQETGFAEPNSIDRWDQTLSLFEGVAKTLDVFNSEIWDAHLKGFVAASSSRRWRKSHLNWPSAHEGFLDRRRLCEQAKEFWVSPTKPRKRLLNETLTNALSQQETWRRKSAGSPIVPKNLSVARSAHDQLLAELQTLSAYLPKTTFSILPLSQLEAEISRLATDAEVLARLPRLHELRSQLAQAGLEALIVDLAAHRVSPELARAVWEWCWNTSVLDAVAFSDTRIGAFDGRQHGSISDDFIAADRSHIATSGERVLRAHAEHLVAARNEFPDQSTLVEVEAAKKRKLMPLRSLFQAAPDVLMAAKPCWAMSPLVVAQVLPNGRQWFDVVIFDEASQVIPADAVPAIARAKRIVVAGDEHQLPPTPFFGGGSTEDEDEPTVINEDGSINLELTRGFESVLEQLIGVLGDGRVRHLNWHYRSRDERLIAFSNEWIYAPNGNRMVTFPGVFGGESIRHVLVEQSANVGGQEDSVTAEVERVVSLVLKHAEEHPNESLGVITMGIKHRDRIDAAIRRALTERPDLQDFFGEDDEEEFFVKNLERVQGDERDAIILSIGYGKTPEGRLAYRFGPLLQEGGQRRLNVAVTRAKKRVTLVSSFSHLDMDPDRSKSEGVKMLRSYLEFASSGGSTIGGIIRGLPELNPFEISVRDALSKAGIPVICQYGVAGYWIDFVAKHPRQPGRMVLAIEADGATYHSSASARDRDRLRQEHLERLDWKFHRIWSTDWFRDSESCVAKVKVAYESAVLAVDQPSQPSLSIDDHFSKTDAEATEPIPTTPRSVPRSQPRPFIAPGTPVHMYSEQQLLKVLEWIESDTLLRTKDEALRDWMEALGYKRSGSRITERFDQIWKRRRKGK
jgi:very-short-patch-repair endonuclease